MYKQHFNYGRLGGITGWNAATYHIPYERFPCTAHNFELMHELGEKVFVAMEEEMLGMGPLFDLQYALYMEREQACERF